MPRDSLSILLPHNHQQPSLAATHLNSKELSPDTAGAGRRADQKRQTITGELSKARELATYQS